jgi:hypothetical protein
VPNNFVQFDCTVVDADLVPIPFVLVKISVVSNPNSSGYGWTDSSGYVNGAVPNNQQLKLEVFTDLYCGVPVYSQTFSTSNTNVSLGNIVVNAGSTYLANVTGSVTNCTGGVVSDGYLIMQRNNQYSRYALSAAGTFDFNAIICDVSEQVTFIAEDRASQQQSSPLNYTLSSGNNNVGNLQACGVTTQQFIDYTINGTSYSITYPADSLFSFVNGQTNPARIEVHGNSYNAGGPTTSTRYISFYFTQAGIAAGSTQNLVGLYTSEISDSTIITTPIPVKFLLTSQSMV